MAGYRAEQRIYGYIEYQTPFCYPFACYRVLPSGRQSDDVSEVVLWDCLPSDCKQRLHVVMVVITILSVCTSLFNFVVVAANVMPSTRRILRRNPTMQNYSNYVLSLSLADLLVGAVVLPLAAAFFYSEVSSPRRANPFNSSISTSLSRLRPDFHTSLTRLSVKKELAVYKEIPRHLLRKNSHPPETSDIISQAGVRMDNPEALIGLLGFFTHLSLYASLFTLAASSADRFYISTKATPNRNMRLTRSSCRDVKSSLACLKFPCAVASWSRSAPVVAMIWITGAIFAIFSLTGISDSFYRQVGHVFVLLSFTKQYSLTAIWYTICLALPLVLTWLFSALLCLVIWRRKKKLQRTCMSPTRPDRERIARSTLDRERESSFLHTSKYSSAETPAAACVSSNSSDLAIQQGNNKESEVVSEVFSENNTLKSDSVKDAKAVALRRQFLLCKTFPGRKRPASFDTFLVDSRCDEERAVELRSSRHKTICDQVKLRDHPKTVFKWNSFDEVIPPGYVAKRLLSRRSWNGCSSEIEAIQKPATCQPPVLTKRAYDIQQCPNPVRSTPTTPSPTTTRRSDLSRVPRVSSRIRRMSSAFRAREFFLRSRSFESHIVRTLCAVVVTLSCTALPMLVVLSRLSTGTSENISKLNGEVTASIIAMIVLLSNSLWNCVIYGARMPYFRTAVLHVLRKIFRYHTCLCCTERIARRISLTASSIRKDSEIPIKRPTRLHLRTR